MIEEASILLDNESNNVIVAVVYILNNNDFVCENYILNELNNTLYDVYSSIKSAKILWDVLDKKQKVKDVGMKKNHNR